MKEEKAWYVVVMILTCGMCAAASAFSTTSVQSIAYSFQGFTLDFSTFGSSIENSSSIYVHSAHLAMSGSFLSPSTGDSFFVDFLKLKLLAPNLINTSQNGWSAEYADSTTSILTWNVTNNGQFLNFYGRATVSSYNLFISSVMMQLSGTTRAMLASASVADLSGYTICWAFDFIPSCSTGHGFSFGVDASSNQPFFVPQVLTYSDAITACSSSSSVFNSSDLLKGRIGYLLDLANTADSSILEGTPFRYASTTTAPYSLWFGGTVVSNQTSLQLSTGTSSGATYTLSTSTTAPTSSSFMNVTATLAVDLLQLFSNDEIANSTALSDFFVTYSSQIFSFTAVPPAANHTYLTICMVSNAINLPFTGQFQLQRATVAPTTTAVTATQASSTAAVVTTAAPTAMTDPPITSQVPVITQLVPRNVHIRGRRSLDTVMLSDPDQYVKADNTIEFIVEGSEWISEPIITLQRQVNRYDDPLGMFDYLNDATLLQKVAKGNSFNLTFLSSKCLTPKRGDTLFVTISNSSLKSPGDYIRVSQADAGENVHHLLISVPALLDEEESFSGLVMVSLIAVSTGVAFLLDYWFQCLMTGLQLQTLIALGVSTCAPPGVKGIVKSAEWGMWPLSEKTGDSSNPVDYGRMVLNWGMTGGIIILQIVVLLAFTCFGTDRSIENSKVRTRFPATSLFVALALFSGSMFSCVRTFALSSIGLLQDGKTNPMPLAVSTFILLFLEIVIVGVSLFKLIAKLVYKDVTNRSVTFRLVFGGFWQNQAMVKRWGPIFEDVNGSSFWYMAVYLLLAGANAALSSFLPGSRPVCSKQYFMILAINGCSTIIMFLRRPFKSTLLNMLNLAVSLMTSLTVIGFSTAMTCSRKGGTFSLSSAWIAIASLLLKSFVVLGMALYTKFMEFQDKGVVSEIRKATAPRRRGGNPEDEGASIVVPLVEKQDEGLLTNVAYKPAIPVPFVLGGCVVCREVGFGPKGGLQGTSGPSIAMQLSQPYGIVADQERLYIVDTANHRVVVHRISNRRMDTICGGNGSGYAGDHAHDPQEIKMSEPRGIALGQQCIYLSDTENDCIRRVDFASRQIHTVFGGLGESITLSRPMGLATLGHLLFVADSLHHRVICIDLNENTFKTVAGTGFAGYDGTGSAAAAARLNNPQAIAADRTTGTLYIADTGNHRVVCIDPVTKKLRVVLGISGAAGESFSTRGPVPATSVNLCLPTDVACLPDRSIAVCDGGNTKVWRVDPSGHSAIVILPPSENIVPRCICVAYAKSSLSPEYDKKHVSSSSNPIGASDEKFEGLYVSDSVHSVIMHVDCSDSQQTTFNARLVHELHEDHQLVKNPEKTKSQRAQSAINLFATAESGLSFEDAKRGGTGQHLSQRNTQPDYIMMRKSDMDNVRGKEIQEHSGRTAVERSISPLQPSQLTQQGSSSSPLLPQFQPATLSKQQQSGVGLVPKANPMGHPSFYSSSAVHFGDRSHQDSTTALSPRVVGMFSPILPERGGPGTAAGDSQWFSADYSFPLIEPQPVQEVVIEGQQQEWSSSSRHPKQSSVPPKISSFPSQQKNWKTVTRAANPHDDSDL